MLGNFQFKDFIVKSVDYKANPIDSAKDLTEDEIHFAYTLTNEDDTYLLSILTHVIDIQKDHYLDIKIENRGTFVFQDDTDVDSENKEKIIKENGSAIMFPYIRSLLYNLTCADSCSTPIVLPTVNFTSIIEELDNKKICE